MLSNGFMIEVMTLEDLPGVLQIEEEAQDYPWSEKIFADCLKVGYQGYVIRQKISQQIIGFSFFSEAADECHLLNIAIARDYQRRGFGNILLHYCLERYRHKHIKQCYLEVRESNLIAQQIYQRAGFKIVGIRRAYYPSIDGREDAFVMSIEF